MTPNSTPARTEETSDPRRHILEEGPVTLDAEGHPHENVLAAAAAALVAQLGGGVAVEIVTDGTTRTTVSPSRPAFQTVPLSRFPAPGSPMAPRS